MSATPDSYIYTGPWINWSKGAIPGSTITLTQRDGSLLTAFLGIFVTVAGAACWRILSFTLHQCRSQQGRKSAIHLQQQTILRNETTPGAAAWQMTQLAWYWRKISDHSIRLNLPYIALAFCNMTFFTVAGVFSSEVTKAAGNETLIRSPRCGILLYDDTLPASSPISAQGFNALEANESITASAYSRGCYGAQQDALQCNQFTKKRLGWNTHFNVSCPFAPEICFEGPTAAFQIESQLINSHDDLGMNSKKRDRLTYHKTTTCSVLHTKDHVWQSNDTNAGGDPLRIAHYTYSSSGSEGADRATDNETFIYNLNDQVGFTGYSLTPLASLADNANVGWSPSDELRRSDADVTIMFLAPNTVTYTSPIHDPWFRATTVSSTAEENNYTTFYESDYQINVLACADQYQICNAATDKCTTLTGALKLSDQANTLKMSRIQKALFTSIHAAIQRQSTYFSVHTRGANALRATDTLVLSDFTQADLPDNQWTIEVTDWFAHSMAKLQQHALNYATGPAYVPEGLQFVPGLEEACDRQKIRSASGYISFSVLGTSIILILGGLLILTAFFLDTLVGLIRKKYEIDDYKRVHWVNDEKLHLQRKAFEATGQGHWLGGEDAVPVTAKNDRLAFATNQDAENPMLELTESTSIQGGPLHSSSPKSSLSERSHGPLDHVTTHPERK